MIPCLCIVFALAALTAGPQPKNPAADFERLERRMQELVEQERFDELARDGEAAFARADLEPWQRRELAFYAIRGYHRTYAATGQATGLCRARSLLRRVEREVGLGDDAAIAARLRDVTEDGLRRQGPKDPCTPARSRPASVAPTSTPGELLPVKPERQVSAPPAAAPPPSPAAAAPGDDSPPLIDVTASRPRPARPPAPAVRVTPEAPPSAPVSAPPLDPDAQLRRRDRIIAGSVLLVVGAGFGVGMGAALMRRAAANNEIYLLGERMQNESRPLTESEFKRVEHLFDVYRILTPVAGVTGAASAIATITGIALLALPQRGRATTTVSASPSSAMLTLSGRF